jgi:hypothetical protein
MTNAEKQLAALRKESERLIDWNATYTLDQQIALARLEMGETRWNELQAEWGE